VRDTSFKRVVTGLNSAGESVVQQMGPIQARDFDWGDEGQAPSWGADIWSLGHDPVTVFRESRLDEWGGEPPPAGAAFRIVTIPAHGGFPLHTTDTIDFVIVLSGRVWLTLEEGEAQLEVHDCVVITGVLHGWQNRGDEPCMICGVLLSRKAP